MTGFNHLPNCICIFCIRSRGASPGYDLEATMSTLDAYKAIAQGNGLTKLPDSPPGENWDWLRVRITKPSDYLNIVYQPSGIAVCLRKESIEIGNRVLVRIAAGDLEKMRGGRDELIKNSAGTAANSALEHYDNYRGLITQNGFFGVSMFSPITDDDWELLLKDENRPYYFEVDTSDLPGIDNALPTSNFFKEQDESSSRLELIHFDYLIELDDTDLTHTELSLLRDDEIRPIKNDLKKKIQSQLTFFDKIKKNQYRK